MLSHSFETTRGCTITNPQSNLGEQEASPIMRVCKFVHNLHLGIYVIIFIIPSETCLLKWWYLIQICVFLQANFWFWQLWYNCDCLWQLGKNLGVRLSSSHMSVISIIKFRKESTVRMASNVTACSAFVVHYTILVWSLLDQMMGHPAFKFTKSIRERAYSWILWSPKIKSPGKST